MSRNTCIYTLLRHWNISALSSYFFQMLWAFHSPAEGCLYQRDRSNAYRNNFVSWCLNEQANWLQCVSVLIVLSLKLLVRAYSLGVLWCVVILAHKCCSKSFTEASKLLKHVMVMEECSIDVSWWTCTAHFRLNSPNSSFHYSTIVLRFMQITLW